MLAIILSATSLLPVVLASTAKSKEEAGAVLFRDKGCTYCHGATGAGGKRGPDLSGLRTDKLWPAEKIKQQIVNGGSKMPPFGDSLSGEEIGQLVAYLRAKHRPVAPAVSAPEQPSAQ